MSNPNLLVPHWRVGRVTYSIPSDAVTQGTTDQIGITVEKDVLCGPYDVGSTKRKLAHDESNPSKLKTIGAID